MKPQHYFFCIIIFCMLFSCSTTKTRDDNLKIKLDSVFNYHIKNNKELIFRMDTITDFKWDYFIVLPPYTNVQELSNKINVDLNELNETGIKHSDRINLLVFIKNNKLYKYTEYPPNPDFSRLNSEDLYPPEDAVFKMSKPDQPFENYYIVKI
jgi:hypothetical protein